jgi:MFS family permease
MATSPRTSHDTDVDEQAGYLELLRGNLNFRRLWAGTLISYLGDWFNTIALYTLVSTLSNSPFALGLVFIVKMLPWAIVAPLAGVIVDRFNRRRLMIGADIARAVIVLGFLLIDDRGDVPWLYALMTAQVVIGAVFQPAKSSSIPNITTPRELLTANAISSATWSTMLAVGAALGGLATEWLGTTAVFVIDSVTYLVSAVFIYGTTIPQETEGGKKGLLQSAVREIVDGWRHLQEHVRVRRIALAKATWALGGGALVYMLTLIGDQIQPGAVAAGIGVLFMARGIGTGIGPVVTRALFTDRTNWPTVIGGAIALCGVFYLAVGFIPWSPSTLGVAAVCALVVIAHAASASNWVISTVMLQKRTEDRYRGRVFSTEWLLVMIAESVSIVVASMLLELDLLTLRQTVIAFAALQIASGLLWIPLVAPKERRETAVAD